MVLLANGLPRLNTCASAFFVVGTSGIPPELNYWSVKSYKLQLISPKTEMAAKTSIHFSGSRLKNMCRIMVSLLVAANSFSLLRNCEGFWSPSLSSDKRWAIFFSSDVAVLLNISLFNSWKGFVAGGFRIISLRYFENSADNNGTIWVNFSFWDVIPSIPMNIPTELYMILGQHAKK